MGSFLHNPAIMFFCKETFDRLPVAIDFIDENGKIIYINKAFCNFLGVKEEDTIGKMVTEVNPNSKFLENIKRREAEFACNHKFPNGKEAIVHRIPLFDEEGKIIGGFGMILFDNVNKVEEILNKLKTMNKELKFYKSEYARQNSSKYTLNDIIGESREINGIKNLVKKFARVNSNVMISGESGVGKELFAHSIHYESARKDKPFVTINCSAIPENLIEAELFGYEDGAFTGAKRGGNMGKFQVAEGGTIFFDEIAEMPIHLQSKLLRVLQEREIVPVGGKSPIPVDVRVICASYKNLEQMVKEGTFREDLYYRLNVLTLEIPPLRNRKEDIPLLIEAFLASFYKDTGMYRRVPKNVMDILVQYNWNGNVRELRNIIEKISVNSEEINISISDLPAYVVNDAMKGKYTNTSGGLSEILSSVEKEIIINMLKECNYNKSEVAKKLNISRITLYRKIEEYSIEAKM